MTPQIDDERQYLLHIHPSVSIVTEKRKVIDLGTAGVYTLPLASSNVNETDTIVRAQDGNIVAIGGLDETADQYRAQPGCRDSATCRGSATCSASVPPHTRKANW